MISCMCESLTSSWQNYDHNFLVSTWWILKPNEFDHWIHRSILIYLFSQKCSTSAYFFSAQLYLNPTATATASSLVGAAAILIATLLHEIIKAANACRTELSMPKLHLWFWDLGVSRMALVPEHLGEQQRKLIYHCFRYQNGNMGVYTILKRTPHERSHLPAHRC